MKKIAVLFAILIGFISQGYCQNGVASQAGNGFNFTRFTNDRVNITPELKLLTTKEFQSHPEFGVLPYDAPCKDCIELLQKRDETHRYFVKEGTKGKEFYAQSSYGNLNYYDESGKLRTIDPRIKPSMQSGIFKANHQPLPVTINIPAKFTSVLNAGKELQVNRNVNIYVKHKDGSITSLGEPDWTDYTAGDDGVIIHNLYPGIDLQMQVGTGNIESFYKLNRPLVLGDDGWLVIQDNMKVPEGLVYDYSHSIKRENNSYEGTLFLNNQEGTHYFYIGTPAAYDENNDHDNAINLNYEISQNGVYDLYVPIYWMNDPNRSYPLIIDPIVSATSTLPQAQILGSGYSAQCPPPNGTGFTNGCPYLLNVGVPAACTVYAMIYSFNYRALGSCNLNAAGWDLTWGACRSPSTGLTTYHTCTIGLPGLCILQNLSCFADFQGCIPPPQCSAYSIPMYLTFYRCVDPGPQCAFSCVNADTPWNMTVTGRAIDVTTQDDSVCLGSSVNLSANATWNVGPVVYTWNPGGLVGQTVSVSPTTTTQYIVTARTCPGFTDANDSAVDTATVKVFPNDNPGFTVNPNPVCATAQVAIAGLPGGPASSYSWILPGATPAVVDSQQNINVAYANAGNYNIILQWTSPASGCVFYDTIPITVNPGIVPSITIPPVAPICQGDNVTFTGDTVNAGATPTYQWYVNGNPVGGSQTTYSSTALNNGDVVTVVLTASGIVCNSNIDTSNAIVMVVNPLDSPAVSITVNPIDTICPGSSVTFTADTTNGFGGPNPTFQWQVNGANVAGANGITYTSSTWTSGDMVQVVMTSNAPCPVPPTATSNQIVIQVYPFVTVTTSGDTTVCAGEPVPICAVAANGTGGPYNYAWDNGGGTGNCVTVSPVVTTVYTVSATDSCNSNPATGQVTVTVIPPPIPIFTFSPTDASILAPTVYFTDQTVNGIVVSWDFGDSACGNNMSILENPSHSYCAPGTYIVKLVVTNVTGCPDSVTEAVEINDEYYFYIPNSFTPNGDGINDFFAPQGTDALQVMPLIYTMTIYDRWGEKIFETDNSSLPWTGQANSGSKIAEAGVYVYRIKFQDPHYSSKELVGSVTLLR